MNFVSETWKNCKQKDKVLEFIKRNRSHSPSEGALSAVGKTERHGALRGSCKDLRKSVNESSEITATLLEIKEKLKKLETMSLFLENWKDELANKEKELKDREWVLHESEEKCKKKQEHLKSFEKTLKAKEETLKKEIAKERESLLKEVQKSFQQKSSEIQHKELQLTLLLDTIKSDLVKLNQSKEELIKLECSSLLTEMINQLMQTESLDRIPSPDLFSPKFGRFETIYEESIESSNDLSELYSSLYSKNHSSLLKECDDISKENRELSDKLEALMSSLKLE